VFHPTILTKVTQCRMAIVTGTLQPNNENARDIFPCGQKNVN